MPDAGNVVVSEDGLCAPGAVTGGSGRVYQAGRDMVIDWAIEGDLDRLVGPRGCPVWGWGYPVRAMLWSGVQR